MSQKFNPKIYEGKPRVYKPVPGTQGVLRLWKWNVSKHQYEPPEYGKPYEARKIVRTSDGLSQRKKVSFSSLEEARSWLRGENSNLNPTPNLNPVLENEPENKGPLFSTIIEEWRKRTFSRLTESTQISYDKLIRLHLGHLKDLGISEITPKQLDTWIDNLKDPDGIAMQNPRRQSFDHELSVLSVILKYYGEYYDDPNYRYPVKDRHFDACTLNKPKQLKSKDLTSAEMDLFLKALKKGKYGETLVALATLQFYQALRISEAAALHWSDVQINSEDLKFSRVKISRSVFWGRKKGIETKIKVGFKNSASNDGVKEQPLFPESHEALMRLKKPFESIGLVFHCDGKPFEYRQIQHAYDIAFKRAGLNYTGTHIMRHGGCRMLYNEGSDLEVAKQHLGNTSTQSTLVYAKRQASALTEVVATRWENRERSQMVAKKTSESKI